MRIERVVAGVDFSQPSVAAAEWISRHLPAAELTLVHCLERPTVPTFLARHTRARDRTMELAREGAVERLELLARSLGVGVRSEVRECAPVDGLTAAARGRDADLIVVATTGTRLGSGYQAGMGRTAERLARCAPVPVLLCAEPRREPPRHIVVALDDADITPMVLAWTRELAARFDARVSAVHVVSSAVLTHVMSAAAIADEARTEAPERVRDEFHDESDRWIRRMVESGLDPARVTSEVDFGEPGQEIVAAAVRHRSDLIVLGGRGAGRVRRAILGSVVSEVLHRAPCPVLVVVDPADDAGPVD